MPTYTTPTPIDLAIDVQVGAVEVVASERGDTVVTVSPTSAAKPTDQRGAEQTTVELDGQRLTIVTPKPRFTLLGPSESVDVRVELPAGSRLTAEIALGSVRTTGRLGATRVKASSGGAHLDVTGDLWVRAGHGSVSLEAADGDVEITADHGQIRLGRVAGDALLKASHGSVRIEETRGQLEVKLSYGDLEVGRALGPVVAKTAYGSIQLHEVGTGPVEAGSGYGEVGVGIRTGVPVWLDLASKIGRVRNELEADLAPSDPERALAVRARTAFGDITVRRVPLADEAVTAGEPRSVR